MKTFEKTYITKDMLLEKTYELRDNQGIPDSKLLEQTLNDLIGKENRRDFSPYTSVERYLGIPSSLYLFFTWFYPYDKENEYPTISFIEALPSEIDIKQLNIRLSLKLIEYYKTKIPSRCVDMRKSCSKLYDVIKKNSFNESMLSKAMNETHSQLAYLIFSYNADGKTMSVSETLKQQNGLIHDKVGFMLTCIQYLLQDSPNRPMIYHGHTKPEVINKMITDSITELTL